MKQKLVFLRFGFLLSVFFFVLASAECQAQKNASRKAEKDLFGKTGKSKPPDDKIRVKGAAGKAMREQEKKEARREKEDEKNIEKLRNRHIEIQSTATQERMSNNGKKTEASYKSKKQKQRKEQVKPELKQPEQPKPPKDQAKPKAKKPPEPKLQKGKTKVKVEKPKPPKAQKNQAKVKKQDPKKQPKLKQHKVKKYGK